MAYRTVHRNQLNFLPPSIEEYVGPDDPVRVYDCFIDALDLADMGMELNFHQVGNSSYDPRAMLKLLIYGYSYGWRSSRKLERALHHNLSFIWLMGDLKPDHKTIANFRKNHKEVIKSILKQSVRLCIQLDLIAGNTLFADGSKFRANASINRHKKLESYESQLNKLDERIEQILAECEQVDQSECEQSLSLAQELQDQQVLKKKVENIVAEMKQSERPTMNATDRECVKTKGRQGSHSSYNAQIVVDEKHGLIVQSDAVAESDDKNQFTCQMEQAQQNIARPAQHGIADAGYWHTENLKQSVDQGLDVIVPTQQKALHQPKDKPFAKEKFHYDAQNDQYLCPEGKVLRLTSCDEKRNKRYYRMADRNDCHQCPFYTKDQCSTAERGRTIVRLKEEELKEQLEARYESESGQELYALRKSKVELPFGHIKRNLNCPSFLVRGVQGAKAEMSLLASCFNIVRMMTLLGGAGNTIKRLQQFKMV